jgi:hypothetical protein
MRTSRGKFPTDHSDGRTMSISACWYELLSSPCTVCCVRAVARRSTSGLFQACKPAVRSQTCPERTFPSCALQHSRRGACSACVVMRDSCKTQYSRLLRSLAEVHSSMETSAECTLGLHILQDFTADFEHFVYGPPSLLGLPSLNQMYIFLVFGSLFTRHGISLKHCALCTPQHGRA